jgi:hypothetical protein
MATVAGGPSAAAQDAPGPNILPIIGDDTGYGDFGPYRGGESRGMPTPDMDRIAADERLPQVVIGAGRCSAPCRRSSRELRSERRKSWWERCAD